MIRECKRFAYVTLGLAMIMAVSACGHTKSDRALSGAGIGAGAGTIGSVIVGGDPLTGAVIGGAAGAATGALTDEDDIDLGEPLWRR